MFRGEGLGLQGFGSLGFRVYRVEGLRSLRFRVSCLGFREEG